MGVKKFLLRAFLIGLALALAGAAGLSLAQSPQTENIGTVQQALGAAFTYQGRLTEGGSPANGTYDLLFGLYDAASGGNQVGDVAKDDVTVADGLFTVMLDFGSGVFTGDARYLEIGVRPGDDAGPYTTLSPRHELTPAPYALSLPGLYTQPDAGIPNVIGGWSHNLIQDEVIGAVIGGGGGPNGSENVITDRFGVIGGGANNLVGNESEDTTDAWFATVGGGWQNRATSYNATVAGGAENAASGGSSFVGGGWLNVADGELSTIGGGQKNEAHEPHSVVAGGYWNISYGITSTISGGQQNFINRDYATIAGGRNNQIYADYGTIGGGGGEDSASANIVYDNGGTIAGGEANTTGTDNSDPSDAHDATVGGGFHNHATGPFSTVGGGDFNRASGLGSTVAGGYSNTASGRDATVPGGVGNLASGDYSFAAGSQAQAKHEGSFVWADHQDGLVFESTAPGQFLIRSPGGVGIGTNEPMATLHVQDAKPELILAKDDGRQWNMEIDPAGQNDKELLSIGTRVVGQYQPLFDSVLTLASNGMVTVNTLNIDGGLDLAEPFAVANAEIVQPGMILSIDSDHPGRLRISDRAYDRLVAGCASGANDINPGLVMAQKGVIGEDAALVALTGRAYCYADASYGSIQPGDLLTTSDTAGHAMKVADYQKAQGAIIGKAMSSLSEGRGFVLVLVGLQ